MSRAAKRRQQIADGLCGRCAWPRVADRVLCIRCLTAHRIQNGERTPTYETWAGMMTRCHNPNATNFHRYGGRGIKVCARWSVFEHFLADMGERPVGKTLDRIDNDGNYEPENCRWATAEEQMNNCSINSHIDFAGRRQTVSQWAREIGICERALRYRINAGWPLERALGGRERKRRKKAA